MKGTFIHLRWMKVPFIELRCLRRSRGSRRSRVPLPRGCGRARSERPARTTGGPDEELRAGAVGTERVGEQALPFAALADEHGAGTIAEEGKCLLVGRVHDPAVGVGADDKGVFAGACGDELHAGDQGVHEAGTGGFHLDRRTDKAELILHQTRRGWERHVGRERPQHEQVDLFRIDAGTGETALGGLDRQIAGGLVGERMPALENAGTLDDPLGVEAEAGVEVFVADDRVRHVTAGSDNPHAHQSTATRARHRVAIGEHRSRLSLDICSR